MRGKLTEAAARSQMASLCARAEMCSQEIREKLLRKGLSPDETESVIGWLRENRFVDDERFAGAFARDKTAFAAWGPRKIRLALMQKRIPAAVVEGAVASLDAQAVADACFRVASQKARSLCLTDRDDRARFCRHLLSRGFGMDHIRGAIARLREEGRC